MSIKPPRLVGWMTECSRTPGQQAGARTGRDWTANVSSDSGNVLRGCELEQEIRGQTWLLDNT
jgi:hypothetical protein